MKSFKLTPDSRSDGELRRQLKWGLWGLFISGSILFLFGLLVWALGGDPFYMLRSG